MEQTTESKKPKKFADVLIRRLEKFLVHHTWLAGLYFLFFKKMTVDEFAIVDLKPGSTVINIGCGSFPHTIMLLAQKRGWHITGIDKDKKAVENAIQVISKYHLSDKIKILYGDGLEVDVSCFDLVIVSHGIEPKNKVLEELGKKIRPDAMIFYRTTWDALGGFYGSETPPANLRIKTSFDRIDGIKSYILVRNENNK